MQDKSRQVKTRQVKTRQDKTRQDKTIQDKTRQDKTRQDKTKQNKTRQDKTRQNKCMPSKNFRNHRNVLQKLHQIVVENVRNRDLGGFLGAFERLWGGSLVAPGSKAPVARFMDASWTAPGRSLRCLGRQLGGSWVVLRTKLRRLGAL